MFTDIQQQQLSAPLDPKAVKSRQQGGRDVSYIESWHAIAEANRIFGFDGWTRETVDMREVRAPQDVDGKWRVGFIAKVRVTVGSVIREGTGYGSGIVKDLGDAYESAVKEAESDAMKRALMTFGNQFGLALYDKEQRGVGKGEKHDRLAAAGKAIAGNLEKAESPAEVDRVIRDAGETLQEIKAFNGAWYEKLMAQANDRKTVMVAETPI